MRLIISIWILTCSNCLWSQYTQVDTLYIPPGINSELAIGRVVEGDSVLVVLLSNSLTESWIIFRRIGHDGHVGTQFYFSVPPNSTGGVEGSALQKASDGGYFLALSTAGQTQYYTGVVLKFSSDFQFEWQRNADHFESDYNFAFWTTSELTNDNNLLVVGPYSWHPDPFPDYGTHFGLALTKYNNSGDTLWTKVLDFGEPFYDITKIFELPNGELILTGETFGAITFSVIYKIGPNGEYWERILQGPDNLYGFTPVGHYYNGKFYTFFGAHQDELSAYPLNFSHYMAVLDVETMTWDDQVELNMVFDSQPTAYSKFSDIVALEDGRAVLLFTEYTPLGVDPDIIMLLAVDTTGEVLWERLIPTPDILDLVAITIPNFLDRSSDGGYTINGYFTNFDISQSHWYVKTDPCGQVLPYACDPTSVQDLKLDNGIAVFPNPASEQINVSADQDISSVSFINIYGQSVQQIAFHQRNLKAEIDVHDLAAGIYIVQIELSNGQSVSRKVIVE
jgi:hypothetical protein